MILPSPLLTCTNGGRAERGDHSMTDDSKPVPAESGADRRRFPRLPVQVQVRLLTDRPTGSPIEGQAVDVSEGGFGLLVDALIVVDTFISLASVREPDGPRVQARVVSRTPVAGRWRLGCEFNIPPTDSAWGVFWSPDLEEPKS